MEEEERRIQRGSEEAADWRRGSAVSPLHRPPPFLNTFCGLSHRWTREINGGFLETLQLASGSKKQQHVNKIYSSVLKDETLFFF